MTPPLTSSSGMDPVSGRSPSGRATHEPSPSVSAVPVTIANAWPEIEYADGYPVDEDFRAIANLPYSFVNAREWLLRELPRACQFMCCQCTVRRGKSITGKPVWRINFSTMGWSGAESIIGLINDRLDLNYHKLSWRRGGHYVFEVPFVKTARSISEIRKQAWETRRAKYGERGHR